MTTSESQDPETRAQAHVPADPAQAQDPRARAQAQAEWRALRIFRAGGALVFLLVLAVGGIVGLATGHYQSGIVALAVGGVGGIVTIAGLILRKRRASGSSPAHAGPGPRPVRRPGP